jgi:hypothetical protein
MPSYLDRYLGGEREAVWAELLALGEVVQDEPTHSDAWAVTRETMIRARHNVALLVERLVSIGYQFAFPEAVWRPPDAASDAMLADFASRFGPLPLSIRAWYEIVGTVDFRGDHPRLSFYHRPDPVRGEEIRYPDPLVIEPLDPKWVLEKVEGPAEDDDPDSWIPPLDYHFRPASAPPYRAYIAPDAIHKANYGGGEPMSIVLPDRGADVILSGTDVWQDVPFVSYLRICFYWGGFPGLGHWFPWSTYRPDPGDALPDLTFLVKDLLPL